MRLAPPRHSRSPAMSWLQFESFELRMQPKEDVMSVLNEPINDLAPNLDGSAVHDDAHVGDIHGEFGTIRQGDHGPRVDLRAPWKTLLEILGPGLIVMVGDNDAGAFGTYTQAGQNYGTA